nr:MAG TPA: Hepcidin [Caudoviricetes sp.]
MNLNTCCKCKNQYNPYSIRKCPYSKQGLYVCVYCCKNCPYSEQIGTGWCCRYTK